MRKFLLLASLACLLAAPAHAGGKARKKVPRAGFQADGTFVPDGGRFVRDGTVLFDFGGTDPAPAPGNYLGGLPASDYYAFEGTDLPRRVAPRRLPPSRRYFPYGVPPVLPPGIGYGSVYGTGPPPLFGPPYAAGR